MNKDLEKKLYEKYPLIFAEKDLPAEKSCMHWGIECGDGWYNLIDQLCAYIQGHCNQYKYHHNLNWLGKKLVKTKRFKNRIKWRIPPETRNTSIFYKLIYNKKICGCGQLVAEQVKEKFGSLRFYSRGGDNFTAGAISFAESMSETYCEGCGGLSSVISDGGWYSTMCKDCKIKAKECPCDLI